MFKSSVIIGFALAGLAAAECPNACSGHGTCCSRDSCTCYEGYTGNDCSMRMCPMGIAHVRSPIGDIDSDGSYDALSFVTDQYPEGVYEQYGQYVADEHPSYLECSNMGLCDREAGTCECFPGFDGAACQRASCPDTGDGVCSGHGTCRSMRQLAQNHDGHPMTYALWDQDAGHGCECDAGYSGPSCAERECPFGVDPLYTSDATPVYSRFFIRVSGDEPVGGDFRLRVFDVHGEDYITAPIWAENDEGKDHNPEGNCDEVVAAFEALPNGAISSGVTCESTPDPSLHGQDYALTFTGTPGFLKTPEVYESSLTGAGATVEVFPWGAAGEFEDRFVTAVTDDNGNIDMWSVSGTAGTADNAGLANLDNLVTSVPALLKIGDDHIVASAVTETTFTSVYDVITDHSNVPLFYTSDTVAAHGTAYVAAGSKNMTTLTAVNEGDVLFLHGQTFTALTSGKRVALDREFGGDANHDSVIASALYVITQSADTVPYTYVSQCSNRGICNTDEGVCECHTGFKGQSCSTQVSC